MTIAGEFCTRTVYTVGRTDTLLEAARRMREHHVGDLVVVEPRDGRCVPVGVITDRDIVVGVLATSPERMGTLAVGDVLTEGVVTASQSERLEDVLDDMQAAGVRRMPVVDDEGGLIGIVTFDDALQFVAGELTTLATLVARARDHEEARRP
jgi:CBS domain-containing protein